MASNGAFDYTVVMPTIPGREELRARALASVWAQTRPVEAVAIINDTRGLGAAWARNLGALMTCTGWILLLDDDDVLYPEHAEVLLGEAERTGAGLVYSYPEFVGTMPDGRPARDPLAVVNDQGHLIPSPIGVPFGPRQAQWLRQVGNFIPVCYAVRTELWEEVGGMPEPWTPDWPRCCEDHGFLIRLLDAGATFHNAQRVTWQYHYHAGNTGGGYNRPSA